MSDKGSSTGRAKAKAAGIVLASATLIAAISQFEAVKTTTYRDIIGIPTVCAGLTDPDIAVIGKTYTRAQCDEIDRKHIEEYGSNVFACINVPVRQGEYDAYSSFAWNVGPRAFCNSTLVRKLNAGDHVGACNEVLRWTQAGGKVVQGLVNRRKKEHEMCMKGIE